MIVCISVGVGSVVFSGFKLLCTDILLSAGNRSDFVTGSLSSFMLILTIGFQGSLFWSISVIFFETSLIRATIGVVDVVVRNVVVSFWSESSNVHNLEYFTCLGLTLFI